MCNVKFHPDPGISDRRDSRPGNKGMTSLVLSCDWSWDKRALDVYPNPSDFFTDVIHAFCFSLMIFNKNS